MYFFLRFYVCICEDWQLEWLKREESNSVHCEDRQSEYLKCENQKGYIGLGQMLDTLVLRTNINVLLYNKLYFVHV